MDPVYLKQRDLVVLEQVIEERQPLAELHYQLDGENGHLGDPAQMELRVVSGRGVHLSLQTGRVDRVS